MWCFSVNRCPGSGSLLNAKKRRRKHQNVEFSVPCTISWVVTERPATDDWLVRGRCPAQTISIRQVAAETTNPALRYTPESIFDS